MSATRRKGRPSPIDEYQEMVSLARKGALPKLLLLMHPTSGEEETWFAERIMQEAREWAHQQEGLDLMDVDGHSPDFHPDSLEAFLSSQSLFATRRALLFSRAAVPFKKWKKLGGLFAQILESDAPLDWMVVHVEGRSASAVAKELAGHSASQVLRFRTLYVDPPPWKPAAIDESEAAKFVAAEARQRGLRMQSGAAGLLVEMSGGKPAHLLQAIQHFELLGNPVITAEDVRAVTAHSAEGSARDFAEALLTGQSATALRLLSKVRSRGLHSWDGRRIGPRDAFTMLISSSLRERRQTAIIRKALDEGAQLEDAMKGAGMKPSMPVTRRMERRLASCPQEHLDYLLKLLRQAEHRLKTGAWRDGLHVLEQLSFESYRPAPKRNA